MTAVAADKQGIYVMVSQRVGRPGAGQGAGLSAGASVRAALTSEGVRVRYAGREEVWPALVSRRTAPPAQHVNSDGKYVDADGKYVYAVGQVWRTRGGLELTVAEARTYSTGHPHYTVRMSDGQWRTWYGGYSGEKTDAKLRLEHSEDLVELVRQAPRAETRPEDFYYELGQVWLTRDGHRLTVRRVYSPPHLEKWSAQMSDGSWRTPWGGYSSRHGVEHPEDLVQLVG